MALFRKFFYRKPPDGLLEISERVYVFDCCFTTDVSEEDEYKVYVGSIVAQLREHFPDASVMVFNFREGVSQSQISSILSEYDMTVMDYPRQYEGCPLLTMEMIHHFLRSSESWLSLGQQNILLMHCERGGWPVLAFMLAALLVYHKQYAGEQRTLDMIYKQAPRELLQLLSPLNPLPSQLRYLHYVSRRNVGSEWPPLDRALTLDCVILRFIPDFDGTGGCRPLFRIYGQDPFLAVDRTPKVLFSMPKKSKLVRFYKQEDCELVKIDIHCHIQGDVVLECISLEEDLQREEMMFRVMFNTAFIRSNILMLDRDAIDILWDAKDRFPKNFRVEILLSEMDSPNSMASLELINVDEKEGLPIEAFDKVKEMFNNLDWLETKPDTAMKVLQQVASSKYLQEKLDSVSPVKSKADAFLAELSSDILFEEVVSNENSDRKKKEFLPPSTMHSVPFHKISDSNSENNAELHGLQALAKLPSLISQRIPVPQSTAAFSSNSSPSCHPTVSRYHSALSPLGIMTLLDDHAASNTSEANTKKIASTSSASGSTIPSESPQQLSPAQLLTTSVSYTKEASTSPQCLSSAPVLPTSAKEASVEPAHITPPPPPPPTQPLLSPPAQPTSPPIRVFSLTPPPCSLARLPPPPPPPPPKVTMCAPTSVSPPPPQPPPRVSSSTIAPPLPLPLPHTCATKTEAPTVRKQLAPVDILSMCVKGSSPEVPPSPDIPSHLRNSIQSTSNPPPPPRPPSLKVTSSPLPSAGLEKSTASSVTQQVGIKASKSIPSPPPPPLVTLPIPKANISPLGKGVNTTDVPFPPTPPQSVSEHALSPRPPPPPPPPHISSNNSGGSSSETLPSPLVPSLVPPSSRKSLSVPYSSGAKGTISEAILPPPLSGMNVPPPPPPTCGMNALPPPPPPSTMNAPPPPPSSMNAPPPPPPFRGMNAPPPPPSGMNAPPPPPSGMNGSLLGGKGQLPSRTPTSRNFQFNQSTSKKSNLKPLHWVKVTRAVQGSLWAESQNTDEFSKAPEFDMSELESLFSTAVPSPNIQGAGSKSGRSTAPKFDKVHLIDLRRANNCEIMLTKVKMPLNDLMSSVLALDDSILDIDQIENLIKFCPTKEEMELLKAYNGDIENLGKCEQYFLELMKVPRVESKLRVFSFKLQFRSQVADLKGNLNIVKTASEEIRSSVKLKRIMQTILSLGNALNQGTARGSAVGFRLDSLLKLSDTRARNNKMTLMHYLCKVLAEKLPELLDFPKSLVSLEAASKMQLKILAEEMQAINKGLEKVEHELTASENDGLVSQVFCQTLKGFLVGAEAEVRSLTSLYSSVGRNADAVALYFGEDPARCPFEQAVSTLFNFVKLFSHAHEDNSKQLELEKKKAQKEAEVEKAKVTNSKKEPQNTQSPADGAWRK
ncbi:formin-like protein 18 isoform X1 [Zingiber officinale]|uniref:formin-like protein 18 isoform X1 n=2 Tax=Zingiber officinale TaxID=94328 RepID=UPI001C4B44F9|nr:formin-like protein 18 isoform X1 [Zingiber officinale]XP_042378165.1 formin-like protein 18 isoform X1 [Zingiber officinale]